MEKFFEFLLYTPEIVPYLVAFAVLLACGLGLPLPEDITLFTMGYLAYNGIVDFKASVVVCLVGVLAGDVMIYYFGHHYGAKLAKRGFFAKLLPPERMDKTRKLFKKLGNKVVFAARFMPGLRAPTYFSAGTLGMPFRVFLFYDGVAALISVPMLVSVVYYFGDQVDRVIKIAREVQHGVVFLIIGIVALFLVKRRILHRRKSSN